jgi:hypothetical protein
MVLRNRVECLFPMLFEIGEGARHHDGAVEFGGRQEKPRDGTFENTGEYSARVFGR